MRAVLRLGASIALAVTFFAPPGSGAAQKPTLAVFEFALSPSTAGGQAWAKNAADRMQDVFVTEFRSSTAVRVVSESKTDAAMVSVGGFGGGVDDDRFLKAAKAVPT